jgi:N-acetyl-alpha-D-muramate 1-phosphate uridylyltransferase
MVLAAGMGSRLRPLTDKTPKPLLRVGDYRMLDMVIDYLAKHGVTDIIINVHHLADQLMEYVAEKRWEGYRIEISDETKELLNTGGGLVKASEFFKGEKDFVLMASDILTDLNLTQMIEEHIGQNALVTLAVKQRTTSRDLLFDTSGNLSGWKHNQTGEVRGVKGKMPVKGLGFSGIHVINSRLFDLILEEGAFSIIDLYLRLAESENIRAFEHSDGKWLEFGRIETISDAGSNPDFSDLLKGLYG